ncbi:SAM-dependent methyltransferase [Flagellimonas eckloniae]|uniref:SAM-dependent methyltransferase n=2 Tax=Flagellimonas eckloniae TaxID=346185 RepID=A0A0Q1CLB7_9FLAO|nr:SAM-dependent methyltransferase [Allomuricauda eckloniae]
MSEIYEKKRWGGRQKDFYSGSGSHSRKVVQPYIKTISSFLKDYEDGLIVCDLGCGDFNVGKNLVSYSKRYIGIDIVDDLIERNKKLFVSEQLEFHCLNIVTDNLPKGDCILVRQVFQHLSNEEIKKVVKKIEKFKHIIVTEHIPKGEFVANAEKSTGAGIRLSNNSGVVLTEPPFNMNPERSTELLRIKYRKALIVTTHYQNF